MTRTANALPDAVLGWEPEAPWGLYIHIPFCAQRCFYCDFAVVLWKERRQRPYVDAVLGEAAFYSAPTRPPATLYYGGGTPTALSVSEFARLHEGLLARFGLAAAAEVTVEANPETVDQAKLEALRRLGVNRLSLGLQAWQEPILRQLGRPHGRAQFERAYAQARAAGFHNVNVDVMFGLPGQRLADWDETLDQLLALAPEHISAYGLQVEAGTPFAIWTEQGRLALPGEDAEASMYERLVERLAATGYARYEVSNFARSGYRSRHNLTYWENRPYLGLGLGAHSSWAGRRWGNLRRLVAYQEAVGRGARPVQEEEIVTRRQAMGETAMLGLRLAEGLALDEFAARFGQPFDAVFGPETASLEARGLVQREAGRLRLTDRGFLLGNQVFMAFV